MSSEVSSPTDLAAGRDALARYDWLAAIHHLEAAAAHDRSAEVLEALGCAYFWADHPQTIAVREEAYRAHRDAGDARGAARVAVALAFDHITFNGQVAVAQGWLELATRALTDAELSPEHGLVEMWMADFAIEEGRTDEAEQRSERVLEVAAALDDTDLELIGRSQQGFIKVVRGDVEAGMRLLDASAAAAVAGEYTDQALAGYACCYLITACTLVRDLPRAAQWCGQLDAHCERVGYHSLQQKCRIEHAEVLVEQGEWQRAEEQMLTAAEVLRATRPPVALNAVVRLGELRRRQGRLDEAIELFREADWHPIAVLGTAAIALDRGDAAQAVSVVERFLRQLPERDRIPRSTGLELLAAARSAAGDVRGARDAWAELRDAAAGASQGPLAAAVHHVDGLLHLAEGDLQSARHAAEDAMHLYERAGAPFGAARARVLLARTLLQSGDTAGAELEAAAAASALDALGARHEAERARGVLPTGDGPSPITARETEVLALVAEGLSNAEIAQRLTLSEHTVHRHVANTLAKLEVSTRAAAVARAGALGLI